MVTVALANGEETVSDQASQDIERQLTSLLEASVTKLGWNERYRTLRLQFLN
jgi:hypothetical protein